MTPLKIWPLYVWLHFPPSCTSLLGGWLQKLQSLHTCSDVRSFWTHDVRLYESYTPACLGWTKKYSLDAADMCCQSAQSLALLGQLNQLLCTDWGSSPLGSCFWGWRESLQEFTSVYLSLQMNLLYTRSVGSFCLGTMTIVPVGSTHLKKMSGLVSALSETLKSPLLLSSSPNITLTVISTPSSVLSLWLWMREVNNNHPAGWILFILYQNLFHWRN